MAAVARGTSDTSTLWAATTTGRVFISKNADTTNTSVTYTRLDSLAVNSPARFVSTIFVDPARFEPCLDFIFELQFADPDDARPHLLGDGTTQVRAQQLGRVSMDRERQRSRIFPRRASPLIPSPAICTRPTTGAF